jgi:hypothetical protein
LDDRDCWEYRYQKDNELSNSASSLITSNSLVFGAGAMIAAGLGMPLPAFFWLSLVQFAFANTNPVVEVREISNDIEVRQQYIPSGYCKGPDGNYIQCWPRSSTPSSLTLSNSLVFGAGTVVVAGLGIPLPAVLTLGVALIGFANALPVLH